MDAETLRWFADFLDGYQLVYSGYGDGWGGMSTASGLALEMARRVSGE